jgi:hypothetical protein
LRKFFWVYDPEKPNFDDKGHHWTDRDTLFAIIVGEAERTADWKPEFWNTETAQELYKKATGQ